MKSSRHVREAGLLASGLYRLFVVVACVHSSGRIPRSGVSGTQDGIMFNFLRNCQRVSRSVWTTGAPLATYERASCFIASPVLGTLLFFV